MLKVTQKLTPPNYSMYTRNWHMAQKYKNPQFLTIFLDLVKLTTLLVGHFDLY